MAQTIQIANATYPDVPSIVCNKSGGGTAIFADPSGITSIASDVASGKIFMQADGTLGTGTASGGGGTFVPIMGAIRPDATLVKKWTYDKKYVADLGGTLPAYSTTATTLVSAPSNETVTLDTENYRYILLCRILSYPVYSSVVHEKGRAEYFGKATMHEVMSYAKNTLRSAAGVTNANAYSTIMAVNGYNYFYVYDQSTAVSSGTNQSGVYGSGSTDPTISNTTTYAPTITVKFPGFSIKGSTTYFDSTAWSQMIDCRMQYVYELWKAPLDGWQMSMMRTHVMNCFNNGGTLT